MMKAVFLNLLSFAIMPDAHSDSQVDSSNMKSVPCGTSQQTAWFVSEIWACFTA